MAPAIAAAAFVAVKDDPDAVLFVMPSDDAIQDIGRFKEMSKKLSDWRAKAIS